MCKGGRASWHKKTRLMFMQKTETTTTTRAYNGALRAPPHTRGEKVQTTIVPVYAAYSEFVWLQTTRNACASCRAEPSLNKGAKLVSRSPTSSAIISARATICVRLASASLGSLTADVGGVIGGGASVVQRRRSRRRRRRRRASLQRRESLRRRASRRRWRLVFHVSVFCF